MELQVKAFVKTAAGIALILAGVMGILLPIVPGILLIISGLLLLGYSLKDFKEFRDTIRKKFK